MAVPNQTSSFAGGYWLHSGRFRGQPVGQRQFVRPDRPAGAAGLGGPSLQRPTYAEQLAKTLHMRLDDRAFAAAEASDASPPVLVEAGHALPINLSNQLAGYIADLHGQQAPHHTTVPINIGSNDYQGFLQSNLPKDPQTIQAEVQNVVGSIAQAIDTLTHAGVEKIVLFTLPDFGITPAAQAQGPEAVAFAHALDVANNTALTQMAASH